MEQELKNNVKIRTKLEDNGVWNLYVDTNSDYNNLIAGRISPEKFEEIYLDPDMRREFNELIVAYLRRTDKKVIEEAEESIKQQYNVEAIKIKTMCQNEEKE